MNRRIAAVWIAAVVGAASARPLAQSDVLARIRDEGLNRSKVQSYFATLTDQSGPRLTARRLHKESAQWARDRMKEIGLSDARLEPWTFGRGWVSTAWSSR